MLTRLFSNLTLSSSSLLRNNMTSTIRTSFQPNVAFNLQQTANMSKYISKSRAKRLPLTTKRAGKGFYKGNRSRKEGWLDNRGHFHRVKEWCTELVVPDLKDFKLKPYVGPDVKRGLIE
mmetsp:Transcript_9546/g.10265  ORF Transcript_9546/g.10265 Transcript_9546/m.10265 type:complete len:119 (+) Transcript_9546:44-400(+)